MIAGKPEERSAVRLEHDKHLPYTFRRMILDPLVL